MKTCELTGPVLNWAVGHALGHDYDIVDGVPVTGKTIYTSEGLGYDEVWEPSINWSQGGPLVEREKIALYAEMGGVWRAKMEYTNDDSLRPQWSEEGGTTPLVAAMRCLVASELGDEVEIPEELT